MTNYKLNEEKMFADITDGVAIIINSETGIYYGMNEFATVIYENLVKGSSCEDILNAIKEFSCDVSTLETNFNEFIDALVKYEIVVEDSESSVPVQIAEEIAKNDNYAIALSEYNDAQELLLADPIHEVKEESGWTPEKDSIGYTKEETAEREKKMEEDK